MRRNRLAVPILLLLTASLLVALTSQATAAVTVTVPYSSRSVTISDLDGDPTTGSWSDAAIYVVPLENGEADPYGSANLYVKHDGTYFYVRLDGKIDVPWASATGNHFWLGWLMSPAAVTGHHKPGQDVVFFGETSYSGVTYPLTPIDAFGGSKPPTKDTQQDAVGMLKYTGTSAPFSFTAEWEKPLSTGDTGDITLVADGSTVYNFYVTTDSNGGGSSGGNIDHSAITNPNTIKFQPVPAGVRDVAVSAVVPSVISATIGDTVTITVTVANQGTSDETVTVHALYDNTEVGTTGGPIAKGTVASFNIAWNTAALTPGTYTVKASVDPVPGETDTADNTLTDGQVILSPLGAVHDLAVTDITLSATTGTVGDTLSVTVTVANQGTTDEIATVHVSYGDTEVSTATGLVAKGSSAVFTVSWNTAGLTSGTYTVKSSVDPVAGETNTADNSLVKGQVTLSAGSQPNTKLDGQNLWLMTLMASLLATVSILVASYLFVSERVKVA